VRTAGLRSQPRTEAFYIGASADNAAINDKSLQRLHTVLESRCEVLQLHVTTTRKERRTEIPLY
jgi:hypothetical protein